MNGAGIGREYAADGLVDMRHATAQSSSAPLMVIVRFRRKILIMMIGVIAAALGLLIAVACIWIPRVLSRRNDPYNHADALAYEKETGRSAQEIEQGNAAVRARQSRSKQRSGTDS